MSEVSSKAPQSDLATRFSAAVVMVALASAAIYLGGWWFRALVCAAVAIMVVEWGDMHRVSRLWTWPFALLLLALLLVLAEWLYPAGQVDIVDGVEGLARESFDDIWVGFAALGGLAAVTGLVTRRLSMGWGIFYIGAPAFALLVLSWAWFELVFWLMLVTWSTDIFAYFAGRAIGGAKLAPRISPNKTWAGLIGGMIGAAIVGAIAGYAFGLEPVFLYVGALMALLAQLGDLYESAVKRRHGVKDSGSLLPGHGGVLDRVDGLLPVAVATLALLIAILGTA